MGFDNHYPNRKDWRKPYRKSKAFDRSCRNHGHCDYCKRSRLYQYLKEIDRVEFELSQYRRDGESEQLWKEWFNYQEGLSQEEMATVSIYPMND